MEDVVKEYIDYTKEKANVDEVANKKLVFLNDKFVKLKEYVRNNPDKELDICKEISLEFDNMDILKSYYAANFVGHAMHHSDVIDEDMGKRLINLFFRNIDNACRFIENAAQLYNVDEDELTDDDIARINIDVMYRLDYKPLEAFIGIDMIVPPIMTIICSNQNLRKYFIDLGLTDHVEYLEPYISALSYVYVGIEACCKTKVLVLTPKMQRGFYIEASDMSNGYYLITLLEAELYKKGLLKRYGIDKYEFNETIYDIATGKKHAQEIMEAEAHQQYYTIYAVQKDGSYNVEDENGELDLNKILYCDMSPSDIPDLEGTHILIMDSEGMWNKPIKWDTGYFSKLHPKLNPYVEILDEISDDEYNSWMEKIKNYEL